MKHWQLMTQDELKKYVPDTEGETEHLQKQLADTSKTNERLKRQLEIATKALEEYADKDKWHYCSEDIEYFYTTKDGWYDAEQALKEIKGVK